MLSRSDTSLALSCLPDDAPRPHIPTDLAPLGDKCFPPDIPVRNPSLASPPCLLDDGALAPLSLSAAVNDDLQQLWPRRLAPGCLSIICGAGQVGVTVVALDMASRVSRGAPWPDGPRDTPPQTPGDVLIVADGPTGKLLAPCLAAARADLARIFPWPLKQASDTSLDLAPIEQALACLPNGHLLVFDALRVGLTRGGELYEESYELFESLARLAARRGVAVLACVRLSQAFQGPLPKRAMGALGSCAAALATFAILPDEVFDDRRFLCPIRGPDNTQGLVLRLRRDAPGAVPYVEWRGDAADSADAAAAAGATSSQGDDRRSAGKWLVEQLAQGPKAVDELEKAAKNKHAWTTVCRAKRRLRIASARVREGHAQFWKWGLRREEWRGVEQPEPLDELQEQLRGLVVRKLAALGPARIALRSIQVIQADPPFRGQVGQTDQGGQLAATHEAVGWAPPTNPTEN